MAEQALIRFRADKALKQEAATVFESLGMDLPTAFRMFMKRSVLVGGLPFDARIPDRSAPSDGLIAFRQMRQHMADMPEMSLNDINNEISAARTARKAKRR